MPQHPDGAMSELSDELQQYCWNRRDALVYQVRLSILYHLSHERFLDRVDKVVSIFTALAATSAVAALMPDTNEGVSKIAAIVTAVLSLVPLVLNPAAAAKRHSQLASEFRKLRAEFERAGEHWTPEICSEMAARQIELEISEPASLHALVAHCQNQLNLATEGRMTHLTLVQRQLMHLVSFDSARLARQQPRPSWLSRVWRNVWQ